jgi:hypothetical protein
LEHNIRTELKEIWWEGVGWSNLAKDGDKRKALENDVVYHWLQQNVGKFVAS